MSTEWSCFKEAPMAVEETTATRMLCMVRSPHPPHVKLGRAMRS
eukprot:SAG31_NODE_3273_length_4475_cov_14.400137_2_plen_44_part_00